MREIPGLPVSLERPRAASCPAEKNLPHLATEPWNDLSRSTKNDGSSSRAADETHESTRVKEMESVNKKGLSSEWDEARELTTTDTKD